MTTITPMARMTACQLFLNYLPFLLGSLASPSCLTALVCATRSRSHPITLLHFFSTVYALRGCSKVSQHVHVVMQVSTKQRGNSTKSELCGVQEKLFSRKVRHVVKSFPFFLVFFPLLPQRICGRCAEGGRKVRGSLSQERKSTIHDLFCV